MLKSGLRAIGIALFLLVPACAFACGVKHLRPSDAEAERTITLLRARDFAALDRLVADYRGLTAVMSDGQPKLIGFYQGLSAFVPCNGQVADAQARKELYELLTEWEKVSRDATAPAIALAKFQQSLGWQARGTGYASTVTEDGWKAFREHIAISKDALEKLGPAAGKDPEWYNAMLDIAVFQGWPRAQFDALYAKAVKKFPSYFTLYFITGLYYSAKWHGSPEQFRAFVETTVRATKGRLGQTMYTRLHWSASQSDMFASGKTDWQRMKAGFERIIADYPDAWNRNNFARFACLAGDYDTLSKQLKIIGNDVVMDAWDREQPYHYCVSRADLYATGMLPLLR